MPDAFFTQAPSFFKLSAIIIAALVQPFQHFPPVFLILDHIKARNMDSDR